MRLSRLKKLNEACLWAYSGEVIVWAIKHTVEQAVYVCGFFLHRGGDHTAPQHTTMRGQIHLRLSHYRVSDWLRDMSVEVEKERKSDPKGRCERQFWRLFPHVFLILSLILYAVLGAQIFQQIEKRTSYNDSEEIDALVRKVLETVQNHSGLSLSLYRNYIF